MGQSGSLALKNRVLQLEATVNAMAESITFAQDPTKAIEPLYDLDVAATLIPMEGDRLRNYLNNHKKEFPYVYRLDRDRRRRRMLPLSSIKYIRSKVLRGPDLGMFL